VRDAHEIRGLGHACDREDRVPVRVERDQGGDHGPPGRDERRPIGALDDEVQAVQAKGVGKSTGCAVDADLLVDEVRIEERQGRARGVPSGLKNAVNVILPTSCSTRCASGQANEVMG
jgi:hypothetical protein